MEKYNFYEALKMAYEGKKMRKENAFIYMCFSRSLEFRDSRNNQLCNIQEIDKSDFTYLWTEIIELTPKQIERKAIEQELREVSEKQKELADRLAKLDDVK